MSGASWPPRGFIHLTDQPQGEPALVAKGRAPDPAPEAVPIEADGAHLLRTVVDHVGAGSSPPRWCAAIFSQINTEGAVLTADGRRAARGVRRIVSEHVTARTGVATARGFYGRAYRTTIASMRRGIEHAYPVLASAPVELFALLCYFDERGR